MRAVDLFCGRGGWTNGLLAYGFHVEGVDIVRFPEYAGAFRLADIGTLDGSEYRGRVDLVVASPPCTAFSRADQPGLFPNEPPPDMSLVEASFRFARAAGVPLVLENVRGLQKFLGQAVQHYGSFYLWGDGAPCLMPHIPGRAGRPVLKWNHRSPSLRAKIPIELALWVAAYHHNRLSVPPWAVPSSVPAIARPEIPA